MVAGNSEGIAEAIRFLARLALREIDGGLTPRGVLAAVASPIMLDGRPIPLTPACGNRQFVIGFVSMKLVTKEPRRKAKCEWCRIWFSPKPTGRQPKFCSAKCRQAACVKRNGTWETLQRKAKEESAQFALRNQLRAELRPEIRRQLTQEFIQSGLVRITGPDQVNALIAGRNEWRGNKLLDELAADFIDAGNFEAATAIRDWKRLAQQMSGRGSAGRAGKRRHQAGALALGVDKEPS